MEFELTLHQKVLCMGKERNYIQDITEIRSMMERSSKFLSLSGWAGIMAGIYALAGAYIAYAHFNFNPDRIYYDSGGMAEFSPTLYKVTGLAVVVLILALVTAILLSSNKAKKKGEKIWNATSRRLLVHMAVPLVSGGLLILVFISKGLIGLLVPATLIFYGLSLYNAGKYTIDEVKSLGITQIVLGLISSYFVEYGLLLWAAGFGIIHIIYGIYMHLRYER